MGNFACVIWHTPVEENRGSDLQSQLRSLGNGRHPQVQVKAIAVVAPAPGDFFSFSKSCARSCQSSVAYGLEELSTLLRKMDRGKDGLYSVEF